MNKAIQQKLFRTKLYCIDTSAIINLFRHYGLPYPPYSADIFEGLWIKLDQTIRNGGLISHLTVLKEIEKRDDEAKKWCYKYEKIFKDIDDCQLSKLDQIKSKYDKSYWQAEINRKGQEWADPWVIALAICEEAIIVSDEKNTPNHIPYIANHFGITPLNLLEFFRDIGLKLRI